MKISLQSGLTSLTRCIAITGMAPLPMLLNTQASRIREAGGVHFSQITTTTVTSTSISHGGGGPAQRRIRSTTTTAMARSQMSHTPQGLLIHRAVSAPRGQITTTTVFLISTSQTGLSAMVPPMSYTVITGMARSPIPLNQRVLRIPVIPSEPLGEITIRTDISICMSSTSGSPMCFIATTAMALSQMSPRQPA